MNYKMMNLNIQKILTALFLLLLVSVLPAQEGRDIEITTISPKIVDGKYELYVPSKPLPEKPAEYSGDWTKIELNRFSSMGPYTVKAEDMLHIFAQPDSTTKPLFSLKLPVNTVKVFAMFYPKNSKEYAAKLESGLAVPWGSYYITNFSKFPISIKLGKRKETLIKSGKSLVLNASATGSEEVFIRAKYGDEVKYLRNTKWRLGAEQREFIMIHQSPDSERLRWLHAIDDKPQPEEGGEQP